MKRAEASSLKPPWTKANPKKTDGRSRKLTTAEKQAAKKTASKAGRPYPNLVDNMRVAAKRKKKS